jgi:hypothetical protein
MFHQNIDYIFSNIFLPDMYLISTFINSCSMAENSYEKDAQIVTDGIVAGHFSVIGSQSWFTFTGAMKSRNVYMRNAADFINFIKVAIGVNPTLPLLDIWRLYFIGSYNPAHDEVAIYPFFNKVVATQRCKGKHGGKMVTTLRSLYSSLQKFMIHLNYNLIASNLLVPSLFDSWTQHESVLKATIFTNEQMQEFYDLANDSNDAHLECMGSYAALSIACLGRGCEVHKLDNDDLVDGEIESSDVVSFDVTRAKNRANVYIHKCVMMDPSGVNITRKWTKRLSSSSNFTPNVSLWMQIQVPLKGPPKIGRKIGHNTTSNYGKEIGKIPISIET